MLSCQLFEAQVQLRLPAFNKASVDTGQNFPKTTKDSFDEWSIHKPKATFLDSQRISSPTTEGDVDQSFNVSVAEGFGTVEEMVTQPDGKIIIGGFFRGVNGAPRGFLARLNSNGSLDATFNQGGTGPNGWINAVALQTDGKILIGGNGALYNGVYYGTIMRLNTDGTPDATFNPSGDSIDGIVYSIVIQPDGKIVVSGLFGSYNNTPRSDIARLNTDGSLDLTFDPGTGFNNPVYSLAVQTDGKIIAGGTFFDYNGMTAGRIVRLNSDGSIDSSFTANFNGGANLNIEKILLQPDGKIIVAGNFNQFSGTATPLGLFRLNPNGTIENPFPFPNTTARLTSAALLPDGSIVLGGIFTAFSQGTSSSTRGTSIITPSPSPTFQPSNSDNDILCMTVQPDGKILLGGGFTRYKNEEHRRIVRLNFDGTVDSSFQASVTTAGVVTKVVPQNTGKILIGCDFQLVNGSPKRALARLNSDGSTDTNFNVNAEINGTLASVSAFLQQPDGKIILGGSFVNSGGFAATRAIRLNEDGSLDTSFNFTQTIGIVNDIKLQPDGKILLGGAFTRNGSPIGILRINTNGSLDDSFSVSPFPTTVQTITLQSDGKIFVGGRFSVVTSPGVTSKCIARLNSDGTIDSSFAFQSNLSRIVNAVSVLPDGKIIIGGDLNDLTNTRRSILRLFPSGDIDASFNQNASGANGTILVLRIQTDGKILIGGYFTFYNNVAVNKLARLNPNGTLDSSFSTGSGANDYIDEIAFQSDSKILLGGAFTNFNAQTKQGIVRLNGSTVNRKTFFDFDGDGKADLSVFRPSNGLWYLLNSGSGFGYLQFGASTDKLVPSDYDGDGKTDLAVFRPSTATWFINRSQLGSTVIQFGISTDIPVPADYDGDRKADVAVYRNDTWFIQRSTAGFTGVQFGGIGDMPVPNAFVR